MGEAANLILEGVMCEECGELIDGDAPGHPRLCDLCDPEGMDENLVKAWNTLEAEAKKFSLTVKNHGWGHFQILGGARVVNYWPTSSRRSAHVKGEKKGRRHITPEQAIALALEKDQK